MISATAASSASLARAVIAFRQPYAQAAARSAQAAGWTTGRQAAGWQAVSPATATLRPAGQRRLFSDTPFVVQASPGADRIAALLSSPAGLPMPGAGAGNAGRTDLLQRSDSWAAEEATLNFNMHCWAHDELPLVVLPDEAELGAETAELVYEALNRNNRKPKPANHGKRPCSRWRRRRNTYGIMPDGSKK